MKEQQALLIVDSEPHSLKLIASYLQDFCYPILTSEQGNLAWQLLSQAPYQFSAIILDHNLSDTDGMNLLYSIKHHPILRNIPVIMISKEADKNAMIAGFKNGIYDFLVKPLDKDLLNLVLKRALRDSLTLVMC